MNTALENLCNNQRQLDADGAEVAVSRQALDETLALLDDLLRVSRLGRAVVARDLITITGMATALNKLAPNKASEEAAEAVIKSITATTNSILADIDAVIARAEG